MNILAAGIMIAVFMGVTVWAICSDEISLRKMYAVVAINLAIIGVLFMIFCRGPQ